MLNVYKTKQAMKRYNIKGVDLAKLMKVSPVTISRYINGTRNPKAPHLLTLSIALHTTPEYLTDMEYIEDSETAFDRAKETIGNYRNQWSENQKSQLVAALFSNQ